MKKLILLFLVLSSIFMAPVFAEGAFVVKRIQFDGLQRVSAETVQTYLPIKIGQPLSPGQTGAIIKALYKTGFFERITLARDGNTLVIKVVERAIIGKLKISGNNIIPTDKLTSVMKGLDIAEGRGYNRAILDRIKQSLLNQYYQLGRYNARVTVSVDPLERNRVQVNIDISEGLAAKIRRINIIGNHVFRKRVLDRQLTISTPGLFTVFTQTDQYSQEKLEASVESLRNYYLDRGYVKFAVKSSQVSITPDRKSVYVTMVIDEGQPYTIKGYSLTGEFVVPHDTLIKLIRLKPGSLFSRQEVLDTQKAISEALGDKGYMYASVTLNPEIDDKTSEVFLDFNVKPGKRTYVRHIAFLDNTKTNDVVLRREIQQMESSVVSTSRLEESKRRLNLLPYMKDVEMSVVPVEKTTDQVDVNYKVTESNAAEITGRIGYSQVDHWLFGAGINQKNFLGTGKTLGLNIETSRVERFYGISYTDPYFTSDGISRSTTANVTRYNPAAADMSKSYSTNEYNVADVFSIPIGQEKTVINRLDLGYGYQNSLIRLAQDTSNVSTFVQSFVNNHGRHFQQINLLVGFSRDSRDKAVFPTRGGRSSVGLNVFLPVQSHSLSYYNLNYSGAWFHPLTDTFTFMAKGAAAYGNSFTKGSDYPFFRNFYAGGIETVRGYSGNSLGPKDSVGNASGGNILVDASVGVILPSYVSESVRTTLFVDGGNTYLTAYNNRNYGGTASGPIRYSTGMQVEWLSMMGPIDVSLARALNSKKGDALEAFQFSLGANFG